MQNEIDNRLRQAAGLEADGKLEQAASAYGALLALIAVTCAAHAQERRLTGPEIVKMLKDRLVRGEERGRVTEQLFLGNGATFYTVHGAQSQGFWEVRGDQYCSKWPPSQSWACYDVMVDTGTTAFVSATGKRYPVSVID